MEENTATFTIKEILKTEVSPALGCTEPAAIALATAAAASLLSEEAIESIEIWVDPNIYKNGIAVSIPGTQGLQGLDMAGAIGAFGGDPQRRLEVLAPITDEHITRAKQLVAAKKVKVHLLKDQKGLFIKTTVKSPQNTAECIIEDFHDNIAVLSLNNKPISDSPYLKTGTVAQGVIDGLSIETWLKRLSLFRLQSLLDDLDDEDLAFLEEGVNFNLRLAEHGLKYGSGLGIGRTLERLVRQKLIKKDMMLAARILTSAASDARMAGVKLPAMSSAGSGNHGLTATLPIWAVKDYVACDKKTVLESIALSHLITVYVKAHTGRLSAVCGCSIAAGAGATAGITYLLGGDLHHIAGAIANLTEDLAGVICDGAKAGCSLKLATAAGTAVQSALFSLQGVRVQPSDGIIGITPEQTMQNVGELSTAGMVETDRTILKIMLEKQFYSAE
ncbi:MAG: serine dehydratase subunit alpha family protein [Deltaproteobacteria bacterium]|nr:serine dehydratase subunit alpha family protein [Deltaproteobacteria bacterium]